jgi:hypothetical protein
MDLFIAAAPAMIILSDTLAKASLSNVSADKYCPSLRKDLSEIITFEHV